jgi:uncharacterized protein (TIGR00730 family)
VNNQPLAYLMREFLESDEGRPIRILSEYLEPLRRFRRDRIRNTVVFFGSARIHSREHVQRGLARLAGRQSSGEPVPREELARAERSLAWSRYYEDARDLAKMLTTWSRSLDLPNHCFVICSGGGPGIMEAANRGAHEAGGKTVGLNVRLPFEQGANPYITNGLHFEFHYFFMRKFWFACLAKALVVFPGGFGTLDELFEILTLVQTEKLSSGIPVVLYGSEYWHEIVNFKALVKWGAISEEDLGLLHFCDTPQEAFEYLQDRLGEEALAPPAGRDQMVPGIAKTRA